MLAYRLVFTIAGSDGVWTLTFATLAIVAVVASRKIARFRDSL